MIRSLRLRSRTSCLAAALLPFLAPLGGCSKSNSAENPSPTPAAPASVQPSSMTPSATDQSASIDRFFINSKPQTPAAATRPDLKGDLSFTVDVLDVRDKVMRIRGWGLRLNPPHQAGDRITIVLVGAIGSYAAMADVEKRPDVSAVLKQPGWDDTGFVSLIDTTRMEPGNYTIFLRIAGADGEAIKSTNRNLTL